MHQDIKLPDPLRLKILSEIAFVLEAIYKKGGMFKYPKTLQCDNGSEFKNKVRKLLENTALRFEEQQQNISIHMQPLWKPLTKG